MLVAALLAFSAGAEAADRWVACAKEGETCRFDGLRRVGYGFGQKWVYRSFENTAACNSGSKTYTTLPDGAYTFTVG